MEKIHNYINVNQILEKANEIKSFILESLKSVDTTLRSRGFSWPLDNIAIVAGCVIFLGAVFSSIHKTKKKLEVNSSLFILTKYNLLRTSQRDFYSDEFVMKMMKDFRLEAKKWILNESSELRAERLKILEEEGMDKYIESIRAQKLFETQKQQEISYILFSRIRRNHSMFWKRASILLTRNPQIQVEFDAQDKEWEKQRRVLIQQLIKHKEFDIEDSKIDEMSKWSEEMQIRMVKQIMRKTSDNKDLNHFKNELYITEICKSDDFYRTFGYDEDEVKAYIELKSHKAEKVL